MNDADDVDIDEPPDWDNFGGYHEPPGDLLSSMAAQTKLQGELGLLCEPEPADMSSVILCARYIQALYRKAKWRQHCRAQRLEAHLDFKVNNKEKYMLLQEQRKLKFRQHLASIRLQVGPGRSPSLGRRIRINAARCCPPPHLVARALPRAHLH